MLTSEATIQHISFLLPEDVICISSLGRTSELVFRKYPEQTLFLDSMGDVCTVATGIALGVNPNVVVAFDTDGSHLMSLSFLPSLSLLQQKLANLIIIVIDNGIYESGGGLPSHSTSIDWVTLGKSFNIQINEINELEDIENISNDISERFLYLVVHVENDDEVGNISKSVDGIESKYNVIRHIEKTINKKIIHPALKA